jgi:hypothetical protein
MPGPRRCTAAGSGARQAAVYTRRRDPIRSDTTPASTEPTPAPTSTSADMLEAAARSICRSPTRNVGRNVLMLPAMVPNSANVAARSQTSRPARPARRSASALPRAARGVRARPNTIT